MKNRPVSSLPANAKSQRAALPSLLGAAFFGGPARRLCCGCWDTSVVLHVPPPQPCQWGSAWGAGGWARR